MFPLQISSPPVTPPSSDEDQAGYTTATRTNHGKPCICIVGVGYVGHSLLSEFAREFNCIGFDVSSSRIHDLKAEFKESPHVQLTTDEKALAQATHYLISVPTLLHPDQTPDFQHLHAAIATVSRYAIPGCVVVLESSVAVGTTRLLLEPLRHLLHCGMSPERVDPGRKAPTAQHIPKIVSALDDAALKEITKVYSKVFDTVVPVSSPEVAEMTKLYENCFRMVNIAFVNEIADACKSHNINAQEVISAASTKPFGFMPFSPGLGVGGHCIPVNPFYLFQNCNLPLLEHATSMMWNRPAETARQVYQRDLNRLSSKALPRVLVVGVGFKPGEEVLSFSPGLSFVKELMELGCSQLYYYDPLVPQKNVPGVKRLIQKNWNGCYLDLHFDFIYVCMRQVGVDLKVLEHLEVASACFLN